MRSGYCETGLLLIFGWSRLRIAPDGGTRWSAWAKLTSGASYAVSNSAFLVAQRGDGFGVASSGL